MPQPSLKRAAPIEQATWDLHKTRIVELWTDPDHTLSSLKRTMEIERGFIATERQYHRQVHEIWRIRKNFTSDELEYIGKVTRERQAQGKRTRVKRNGVRISEANIKRRQSRPYVNIIDLKRKEIAARNELSHGIDPSLQGQDFVVGTPTEVDESSPAPLSNLPEIVNYDLEPHSPAQQLDGMAAPGRKTTIESTSEDSDCGVEDECDTVHGSHIIEEANNTRKDDLNGAINSDCVDLHSCDVDMDLSLDIDWSDTEESLHSSCASEIDDTDEVLQETISNGLKMLSLSESPDELGSQNSSSPYHNICDPGDASPVEETPLTRYARLHEQDFLHYIHFERQNARQGMNYIESCSKKRGLSIGEADDKLCSILYGTQNDFLPYCVYEHILTNRNITPNLGAEHRTYLNNLNGTITHFLELKFQDLHDYVRKTPPYNRAFNCIIVHLPQLISQLSFFHYLTARALRNAVTILHWQNPERSYEKFIMIDMALFVYEILGLRHHKEGVSCWELFLMHGIWYNSNSECWKTLDVRIGSFVLSHILDALDNICRRLDQIFADTIKRLASLDHNRLVKLNIWVTFSNLGAAFRKIRKSEIAIKLLKRPDGYKVSADLQDVNSTTLVELARNYKVVGKYKKSLENLFTAAQKLRLSSRDSEASYVFSEITETATERGPVLYKYLKISSRQLLESWRLSGVSQNAFYNTLTEMLARDGSDEYSSALALRLFERARAPDLQEYLFFENLRDWVDIHGATKADEGRVWDACDIDFM